MLISYKKLNAIEREKIELEKSKLRVAAFLEDFRARWQELLNFENENSRWQTLYVSALILVVSWVLSNLGASGKYPNIKAIFTTGDNSYFLISLALINALYTLAMAYKGFQIQEIAQYLYSHIGKVITPVIAEEFNNWERWRRESKGTPTFIRTAYYFIISLLPTAVSGTILGLYGYHQMAAAEIAMNLFFWFTTIFVGATAVLALSSTLMNKKWQSLLKERGVSYGSTSVRQPQG